MPNWCFNSATFVGKTKEDVDKIESAAKSGNLFETFKPEGNWGTKWDLRLEDLNRLSDTEVQLIFDTAWSPPSSFYEKMAELGFEIDATFLEEGVGFVGYWNNEEGEEYWEYIPIFEKYGDEYRNHMPEDIAEMVDYAYENWKEWQEES